MTSRTARNLIGGIAAAGAITGGIAINRAATHDTLAEALIAEGYTHAAYVTAESGPTGASATAATDPALALAWDAYGANGDPATWNASYLARYGVHAVSGLGSPAVKRYCAEAYRIDGAAVETLARRADNPLRLTDHTRWTYGRDEREDLRLLGRPGAGCAGLAWTNYLVPLLLPSGGPTPTPPPPTPEPPDPEPTPDPPAPGWQYGWAVRQVECVGGQPNSLCLDLRFSPAVVSTGRGEVAVEVK